MSSGFTPIEPSVQDIKALRPREAGASFDIGALGRLACVQRMLQNSLTVVNPNPGDHLLGTKIDWALDSNGQPIVQEINIPPDGRQRIENFQFMTLWYRRVAIDVSVQLINNNDYACYYEVNKLLASGQPVSSEIVNPWPGATARYPLDAGERLFITPVAMHRFVLDHDPELHCITPPVRVEKA